MVQAGHMVQAGQGTDTRTKGISSKSHRESTESKDSAATWGEGEKREAGEAEAEAEAGKAATGHEDMAMGYL